MPKQHEQESTMTQDGGLNSPTYPSLDGLNRQNRYLGLEDSQPYSLAAKQAVTD
jgi:hypothetical protein